jgi:hypothetical protein
MSAEEADEDNEQEPEQQQGDEDDEDLSELNKSSAATRLNAIVGAATFLSNADPSCKEKMVAIVKEEFCDFSGYVSYTVYQQLIKKRYYQRCCCVTVEL